MAPAKKLIPDPQGEHLKLFSRAQKATHSRLDSEEITREKVKTWKKPPFQRPLQLTSILQEVIDEINADGVIPGILTFGILDGDRYLLDGQHRVHAYLESDQDVVYAEVRIIEFQHMADMAEEFRKINNKIARMKPDDDLRALEEGCQVLRDIRQALPWVGYSHIRANEKSPLLGMASLLRFWCGSAPETPVSYGTAPGKGRASSADLALTMTPAEKTHLLAFGSLCYEAWGRDVEHSRLYGGLNMGLCAWLYRRLVIMPYDSQQRAVRLNDDLFKKCLMSVAADPNYIPYLLGRQMRDRDRSPTYARLRDIFARRITSETGNTKVRLPKPEWAGGRIQSAMPSKDA